MSKPLSERRLYPGPARPNPARRVLPSGRQGPMHFGGYYGIFHEQRLIEAAERQAVRNERTPEQQIKELDRRLGVGVGAKKERQRLSQLITF